MSGYAMAYKDGKNKMLNNFSCFIWKKIQDTEQNSKYMFIIVKNKPFQRNATLFNHTWNKNILEVADSIFPLVILTVSVAF